MRAAVAVLSILLLAALTVVGLLLVRHETPPPVPVFGWVGVDSVNTELHRWPMTGWLFSRPLPARLTGKVKVEISATEPLSFGITTTRIARRLLVPAPGNPITDEQRAAVFSQLPCAQLRIRDRATSECVLAGEDTLLLQDERTVGDFVADTAGVWKENQKAIDKLISNNRVQVTLSLWQCIEHCPASTEQNLH